jgi:hypothetical protein
MAVTFSKKEIGLLYNLLQSVDEELLESMPSAFLNDSQDTARASGSCGRLNKLIASNLRMKLRSELEAGN